MMADKASIVNLNLDSIFKKKDNVVIAVMVVLSLLFARNVYRNQSARHDKLKLDINAEKEKLGSLERIVSLNEKLKKLKEKSWDTVDSNVILERVFNLGLETQIKIRDISPAEKRDEKTYFLIPLAISCEATYMNLYRFIKKLETYPMLTRVVLVNASPLSQREDGELILKVTLSLEAVYFK